MRQRPRTWHYSILGFLTLLILWEMGSYSAPTLVPGFLHVVAAVRDLVLKNAVYYDLWATLARTLIAFSLAVVIGVPLGAGIGSSPIANSMLGWAVEFLRSIPAFVLLPLFLTFLRSGDAARIGMAAFGAAVVMTASTAFGAAHTKAERLEVARVYGASRAMLFWIVLRGILPAVADGIRISLSLSLILVIVGEIMLGAGKGLGTRVNDSLSGFDLPRMYALSIVIGLLGYCLNMGVRKVTSRWIDYGRHL